MNNIVDFAETLRELIYDKINQNRDEMHETHNPVYNDSLLIEIQALEWIRRQIGDLVNNKVRKDRQSLL
jgi:hypothetical protein